MKIKMLISLFVCGVMSVFSQETNRAQSYSDVMSRCNSITKSIIQTSVSHRKSKNVMLKSDQAYQKLDSVIIEYYDEGNFVWDTDFKQAYTYDDDFNVISFAETSESYNYRYMSNMNYDSNGVLEWIESSYSDDYYSSSGRTDYQYQYQNDLLMSDYSVNEYGASRFDYTYDDNSRLIREDFYSSGEQTDSLSLISKTEYFYNIHGLLESSEISGFNEYDSTWYVSSLFEYSYNDAGLLIEYIDVSLQPDGDSLVNNKKCEYLYSDNGNLVEEVGYLWNVDMQDWEFEFLREYEIDESYSVNNLIFPDYFDYYVDSEFGTLFFFNHKCSVITEYRGASVAVNSPVSRTKFWYSDHAIETRTENVSLSENGRFVNVSINPYTDILKVSVGENKAVLELYNVQASRVMHEDVDGQKEFNVESLPGGIYYYWLTIGDDVRSGKLVVD